ncbi:MAG: mycoredoxin [Actinobacteria bacterium]|nr:mycoredoxin [Actinomycetota bacterium]
MAAPHAPAPGTVVVYATTWCPYCHRLRLGLQEAGIEHDVVDVDTDPAAARYVESVNGGNRVVPTVLFADGTTLTNPAVAQVAARLA